MITITTCPVCASEDITKQLLAEDYTVSHEKFEIWECRNCSLRFTQNIPGPEEVGPYYQSDSYISHTDTKKGLINRLYHFVRKTTLTRKRKLIEACTGLRAGCLLDIGAGTGAFAHTAHEAGWKVTGLEPDKATRERAAELYQLNLQDIDALYALPPESFDAITMWHVLEHVHRLHECVNQIKVLLKKNGRALIAVPNFASHDAGVYKQYWAAYDVPRHLYHFSPASMEHLLKQHGLRLLEIRPMWYDSFYISMLSEQYQNGKSNLARAVWTGLISNLTALANKRRCSSVIYLIGK